jgi:hypothetical protein
LTVDLVQEFRCSLRHVDLKKRLFKYPCSYLIHSPSFDAPPDEMRAYVWQRL